MSEPRSIIRNEKGKPDDVVIEGVTCFRLERMDTGRVWIAAYRGDQRVTFGLYSKRRIDIELIEDDLGCIDDTEDIDVLSAVFTASEAEKIRAAARIQGKLLTQFIREAVVESSCKIGDDEGVV